MPFKHQENSDEFELLLRENLDSMYRFALRLTLNRSDAEDIVQEATIRAFRFFDQFSSGTNARAWFLTIVRNIFINDYRKKVLERKMMEELQISLQNELPKEKISLPDSVVAALQKLPEDQRIVVDLFYMEGFSYQEISQVIDCPIGTVMSRLHAARKKLIERASACNTADKAEMEKDGL